MPELPSGKLLVGGGGRGREGGRAEFFGSLMTKCFGKKQSLRPNVNRPLISSCSFFLVRFVCWLVFICLLHCLIVCFFLKRASRKQNTNN